MSRFQFYAALLSLVDHAHAPQEELIKAHLAWLKNNGVDGVLVMGTTGEFPNFTLRQRQQYLETVLRHNPELEVMVNIGTTSIDDVLALQRHAVSQPGVHKILMMPPFYYPDSIINGLAEAIEQVIEHQPPEIPFYLYHFPKMSQVSITPDLLTRLPRVAGIKDTSGDFERIGSLVKQFPEKQFYVGTDFQINRARELGCTGIISGLGNVFPQFASRVIQQGDTSGEQTLLRLRETLEQHGKMPALKAALNQLGLSSQKAVATLPFKDLDEQTIHTLSQAIENIMQEAMTHAH